jgi:predicted metal-dependent HD superfamily phosphohydrolase
MGADVAAGAATLGNRFQVLCARIGRPAAGLLEALVTAYEQPERHYHNLQHITDCLDDYQGVRALARQPDAVELAIWYHDVVYDTHRSDNEEQSAVFAVTALLAAEMPPTLVTSVCDLILATRHTLVPQSDDEALLMDIDLAILGSPDDKFDRYERVIRQEYAWVPEPLFRAKRAAILRGFLARPVLYHTPSFRERLEQPARVNLARSLARRQR